MNSVDKVKYVPLNITQYADGNQQRLAEYSKRPSCDPALSIPWRRGR